LSRILTQNLGSLAAEAGLQLGEIRIRHASTGDDLEVYGSGRLDGKPVRAGFSLRGASVPPSEALRLFVEFGRGTAKKTAQKPLPLGAEEAEASALFRRLLALAAR
jgi:hypothetical protein